MVIRVTGEIKGSLKKEFLAASAEKKRRTLDLLGRLGVQAVRGNIEAQTAPDGSKWTPSIRAAEEGGQTLRKSGALWRSIDSAILDDSTAVVFVNAYRFPGVAKYAMIHNFGGTIRSHGKKLTIPVSKLSRGKSVADMKQVFDVLYVARSANGSGVYIFGKNGTRGKPVALFVLKDSVKIPKREFMGLSPAAKDRMTAAVRETLR